MVEAGRITRRARIAEIAKLAGVGTATVDRVLNDRPHVSAATRQRVRQAKAAIETGAPPALRARPWRLRVFLPGEAGPSTEFLAACLQEVGVRGNATVECVFTRKMEPALLARKLHACAGNRVDAVAFQALDDPRVHEAVEDLARLRIPSLAVLSAIENPALIGFVGLDNRAVGRTAGHLMGRLTRQSGTVAIVTGGQFYRAHEDREMGFRAALRQGFPHVGNAMVCNGHDDIEGNYQAVREAIERETGLVGIYNVGGGNQGVARAMAEAGISEEIVFIGHNLARKTQSYLLDGTMDIVLHLNMRNVAGQVVEALTAYLEGRPFTPATFPLEVITRENMLGATFG